MSDKILFREMLSEIVAFAEAKANTLTLEEITLFFQDASLSDEQMELVYSYLESNKIIIEGHKKNEEIKLFDKSNEETVEKNEQDTNEEDKKEEHIKGKLSVEEDKYLSMYLEEIGDIKVDENEKQIQYQKMLNKDSLAKSRLIELYLLEVVDIARSYTNQGVALSDLIQEGNIGLMLTLDELEGEEEKKDFKEILKKGIVTAIEDAIEEADMVQSSSKQIVSKVNYLNEGVKNLEEEIGRTASIEELAKYMEMSKEEIEDILRVSDDEIIVAENEGKKSS